MARRPHLETWVMASSAMLMALGGAGMGTGLLTGRPGWVRFGGGVAAVGVGIAFMPLLVLLSLWAWEAIERMRDRDHDKP